MPLQTTAQPGVLWQLPVALVQDTCWPQRQNSVKVHEVAGTGCCRRSSPRRLELAALAVGQAAGADSERVARKVETEAALGAAAAGSANAAPSRQRRQRGRMKERKLVIVHLRSSPGTGCPRLS